MITDSIVAKEPRRCKLGVKDEIVEQVMSFRWGIEITAHQDRRSEVKNQIDKASRIAEGLRDVIWKNQFLKIEVKTRIYKSCVRPIITYATETTADTTRTKSITGTAEMRTLQRQNTQPRNKTNLRHTGHCKIDEAEMARVESTHQQNGRK